CLGAETRHVEELAPRAKETALLALIDDRRRQSLADARDVSQERRRSGVQVDAHLIDARLDDLIETAFQAVRRDVVLVLPDADGLRIDLDELGERVLKASPDAGPSAPRDVEVRN